MDVKMFQMDCGESILAYCKDKCLLIDCGSRSDKKTTTHLFDNVINECSGFTCKKAMISHFHDDHINGFMYITDPAKVNHLTFSMVYIPYIFTYGQHWNLIDYKLIEHYLRQKKLNNRKNFSLLDLLLRIVNSKTKILILSRGMTFNSCNSNNQVLWPIPQNLVNFGFGEGIEKYFPEDFCKQIFKITDMICKVYLEANESSYYEDSIMDTTSEINEQITRVFNYDFEFDRDSAEFKAFYNRLRQRLRIDDNNTSIVFQTNLDDNYLFTGDIGTKYLRNIVSCSYNDKLRIHDSFFAIKAPHHGTVTHYLPELFDVNSSIKKDIVFISNGKCKSTGVVCDKYPDNANKSLYKLICTNRDSKKCNNTNTCVNGCCPLKRNCICNLTFDII